MFCSLFFSDHFCCKRVVGPLWCYSWLASHLLSLEVSCFSSSGNLPTAPFGEYNDKGG